MKKMSENMKNKNNIIIQLINKRAWRNGSVSDSRSAGWGFKSLCPQIFIKFTLNKYFFFIFNHEIIKFSYKIKII